MGMDTSTSIISLLNRLMIRPFEVTKAKKIIEMYKSIRIRDGQSNFEHQHFPIVIQFGYNLKQQQIKYLMVWCQKMTLERVAVDVKYCCAFLLMREHNHKQSISL